ncbi:MAG: hypothetical protein JW778_05825 [Candidatus Altiarchaeota archaeon]|nr:hypothetical protein [Candidatus Altiarchaeota archaeon]
MEQQHPYLRPVDLEASFKLKNDHDDVIVEILTLTALKTAIEGVPDTSLIFHMDGRNDFAAWINDVVGCKALSMEFAKVRLNEKHPEETRKQLVKILDYTLTLLEEV